MKLPAYSDANLMHCVHTNPTTGSLTHLQTGPRLIGVPTTATRIRFNGRTVAVRTAPSGARFIRHYGVPIALS